MRSPTILSTQRWNATALSNEFCIKFEPTVHEHTWASYGTTWDKSFGHNIFNVCFRGSPHDSQLIVIWDGIVANVKRIDDVFKMI